MSRCLRLEMYGLQSKVTWPPFKVILLRTLHICWITVWRGGRIQVWLCVQCCISLPNTWAKNGEEWAGCGRDLDSDFICRPKIDAEPYQDCVGGPWCDHSFSRDNVCASPSDVLVWRFLTSLSKCHNFVTTNVVIKHILPYNSAMEHLINYCIF